MQRLRDSLGVDFTQLRLVGRASVARSKKVTFRGPSNFQSCPFRILSVTGPPTSVTRAPHQCDQGPPGVTLTGAEGAGFFGDFGGPPEPDSLGNPYVPTTLSASTHSCVGAYLWGV